jgi:hypothetical protein
MGERDHFEDQGIGGIVLTFDRHKQRAVVHTAANVRVPHSVGSFFTSWEIVSF